MRDLGKAVIWVTGAGSGMGEASAARLARTGAMVILSGRRPAPLHALAQQIVREGGRAGVEALDIADAAAVAQAGARIAAQHGTIDILVNCAGVNIAARRWRDVSAQDWRAVVDINLNGAFHRAQAVLPAMRAQRDGLVINVSSWAGVHVSYVAGPAYVAAKHAMTAMTESLNQEEGVNGVRACAICPAEVSTPILDKRPVPVSAEERAQMIQPQEIAETILFVAAMPAHVCVNQIVLSPTRNQAYLHHHR